MKRKIDYETKRSINMNSQRSAVLFLLAGLIVAVPACGPGKKAADPAAAALESAGATVVTVVPAARRTISEKLTYTGVLEAWRKINITPETGGKLARIHVEEGQRVAQGQLLAELDSESIGLQLKQAEAGSAVADANFKNAARNKDRMDRLAAEKAVSDQQYEQVKLGYDAAKAQLEQAQAGVNLARHARDTGIMKAPWSGIVASKNAQVGDVLNPMMGGGYGAPTGVLTLMDDSRIKVLVEVSPGDIGRLQKGRPALLRVVNGETKDYPGSISILNPMADPSSKKFRVEVIVGNAERKLRPGTFASILFEVQSHENALAVPQKSILNDKYVFVVENGKAVRREVALGLRNTTMVEVLSGLKEGESVIVEGSFGLIDGSPVEVKK
jgi:RND family efflux transporter MFP subunit